MCRLSYNAVSTLVIRAESFAPSDFSKTLFTPAGIDIYLRSPITPENQRLVQDIISRLGDVAGEIGTLSKSGFLVGETNDGDSA